MNPSLYRERIVKLKESYKMTYDSFEPFNKYPSHCSPNPMREYLLHVSILMAKSI